MKKTSRIIAIMLTLCVLCSTIAIVAASKAPSELNDMLESTQTAYVNDFESLTPGDTYGGFGSGSGQAQHYSQMVVGGQGDNEYIAMRYTAGKFDGANYRRDFYIANTAKSFLSNYSYFTLDYDISADKYQVPVGYKVISTAVNYATAKIDVQYITVDTLDKAEIEETLLAANNSSKMALAIDLAQYYSKLGLTPDPANVTEWAEKYVADNYSAYDVDEAIASARLSYPENYTVAPDFRAASGKLYMPSASINYNDESGWYLKFNGLDKQYVLPTDTLVWSHITYAVKIDNAKIENSRIRIYFDGEFVLERQFADPGTTGAFAQSITTYVYIAQTQNPYSVAFDNIMLRAYLQNTYSSSTWYGIDDLFTDKNKETSIARCDDVIYNTDFVSPNGKYVSVDAGATKCYIPGYVQDYVNNSMANGALIETAFDILDFTPPSETDTFDVSCINGAKFTLSEEAKNNYVIIVTPTGYRVSKVNEDEKITLHWYDAAKDGKIIKESYLAVGSLPSFGSDTIKAVDFETGKLTEYNVSGWYWDIDGEGNDFINFEPAPINALTQNEFNVVKQELDGVIAIYPAEVELKGEENLKYVIETIDTLGNPVPFFQNDDYSSALTNVIPKNVTENLPKSATLHLYDSVTANTFLLKKGYELTVLLNGNSITAVEDVLFELDNGAALEIATTGDLSEIYAKTVINASKAIFNNTNIKIGTPEALLTVLSDVFVNINSVDKSYTDDGLTNNLTITATRALGAINLSAPELVFTATNSTFVTEVGTLLNIDALATASISISDSELYSSALIADGGSDAVTLAIENTSVLGDVPDTLCANVLLGKGVKFSSDVRKSINPIYTSGVVAVVTNTEIIGENISSFTACLTTFLASELAKEDIATAIWKDALDATVYTELYYKDAVAVVAHPTDFSDPARFPIATDLDNGWYNLAYNGWAPASEGTELNLLVLGEENIFTPTASLPTDAVTLMANVNLRYTEPTMTLYFKLPESEVKNVSFFIGQTEVEFAPLYNHDVVGDALALEVPIALASFDAVVLTVNFTVNGTSLTDDITVDILTYAEIVAEVYACGTEDTSLVFDLIRYKYEAYLLANEDNTSSAITNRVNALLSSHGQNCKCYESFANIEYANDELLATLVGNEALADKILAAGFDLDANRPALYFYVPASLDVKSLNVKFVGLEHKVSGWDYVNYKITETLTNEGTVVYNDVLCNVYKYNDMLLCNATSIFNITLETDSGVFTGKFSLASYCEELKLANSELTNLAKAFYLASGSAFDYRAVGADE